MGSCCAFGGGATHSGAHSLVGIFGLSNSYPVRLFLAVREFGSMTIWCEDKNGIPRIRGTGSPVLTLARNVADTQLPFVGRRSMHSCWHSSIT